ncbi:hypothetical protein N8093_02505 [Planktomarina temperata]|nr:hypothetical protein [Planktomarina temperata]
MKRLALGLGYVGIGASIELYPQINPTNHKALNLLQLVTNQAMPCGIY